MLFLEVDRLAHRLLDDAAVDAYTAALDAAFADDELFLHHRTLLDDHFFFHQWNADFIFRDGGVSTGAGLDRAPLDTRVRAAAEAQFESYLHPLRDDTSLDESERAEFATTVRVPEASRSRKPRKR